jgi:hypothetical protein
MGVPPRGLAWRRCCTPCPSSITRRRQRLPTRSACVPTMARAPVRCRMHVHTTVCEYMRVGISLREREFV